MWKILTVKFKNRDYFSESCYDYSCNYYYCHFHYNFYFIKNLT